MPEKIYTIKVIPNSKVNKIVEQNNDFLKIKLTAQPEKGKANKALLEFLSQEFKIAKNKIKILAGEMSKVKMVKIDF